MPVGGNLNSDSESGLKSAARPLRSEDFELARINVGTMTLASSRFLHMDSPQQSQCRHESQTIASSQCSASQPSQPPSPSTPSVGNILAHRNSTEVLPATSPEAEKSSERPSPVVDTPGSVMRVSNEFVVETPEDPPLQRKKAVSVFGASQNSQNEFETEKDDYEESAVSKQGPGEGLAPPAAGPGANDATLVISPGIGGPDDGNSRLPPIEAGTASNAEQTSSVVSVPRSEKGAGPSVSEGGNSAEIESKAVSKVAVLENTISEIRIKRRRMQDQMNDLISVEAKRRKFQSDMEVIDKHEKEAAEEVEAARSNLAEAERRLRQAEGRVKGVREEKAVARARNQALSQEHSLAKGTLHETKEQIAALVAKLEKAT